MAPGSWRKTPVVPTVSGLPDDARRTLDRERDLGAREAGVVPVGHQHRTRVPAVARQAQPVAARARRSP